MAQITHGIRKVLSLSFVYDLFQIAVGARRARNRIVLDYLRPVAGMQIIDVGCGTGTMFEHLPIGVRYVGFDLSQTYIKHAQKRFGMLATFYCCNVTEADKLGLPKADIIIAIGVLHHLDDDLAIDMIRKISALLAPDGTFLAVDGCFEAGQSPIARWFLSRDRGQNVRTASGYMALATAAGVESTVDVRHNLLRIPYTHSILACHRSEHP